MEPMPPRPPEGSGKLKSFFIVLCWLLPGISLAASTFFALMFSYHGGNGAAGLAMWVLPPLLLAIGCGWFASFLKLTSERGQGGFQSKELAVKTTTFVLLQLVVTPAVAVGTVLGCGVVTSMI